MDGLALLCALHADGPQSLRRLRRCGVPSLESVAALDVERIAELLASTPASAQRFRREAELLLARLGASAPSQPDAAPEEGDPLRAAQLLEPEAASAEVETSNAEAPAAAPASPKPWDAALTKWRELDALEDAEAVALPIVEESSAPAPHLSPRTPLHALQDLAAESRAALVAAGIVDLEALAACDPLELAEATGLDYSNAARWRVLARRALPEGVERFSRSGLPRPVPTPVVALDEFILRPSPPRAATEAPAETAGGPFA